MTKSVTIRLEEHLLAKMKALAAGEHRSVNKALIVLIEKATEGLPPLTSQKQEHAKYVQDRNISRRKQH